jgi:hypothetical protein
MEIHIHDDYYITSDSSNICLSKKVLVKDKNNPDKKLESFKHLSFYSTIEGVLKAFVDLQIKNSRATTLEALQEDVRALKQLIADKTKDLK